MRSRGLGDGAAAFAAALLIVGLHIASGFSIIADGRGDNDSLMRLVEVRDLLNGQGWFDLMQYRMGPDGGFPMHWSRLVDAPIAAIMLVAGALTGSQATGELVALLLWPFLLSCLAIYLLIRLARLFAGDAAVLPTVIVGAVALYFLATFAPGALDHHNVQLVLALGTMLLLAQAERDPRRTVPAGVLSALMLAVGMEAMPYVAVAGLWCAARVLMRGERSAPAGFGVGFAATAGLCFVATVPPSLWGVPACDAFSAPQLAIAAICGAGLAVAALAGGSVFRRATALAAVAIVTGLVLYMVFPQCLADPYANVAPRLRTYWLNSIIETLPIWTILTSRPVMAFGYHVTPLIAAVVLGMRIRRDGVRDIDLLIGSFLAAAILVSLWQVRGAMFAIPLAVIPLSGWIAETRAAAASGKNGAALRMALAWLVSINLIWAGAAKFGADALDLSEMESATAATGSCYSQADYDQLAAMPAATVLGVSNLGASILRFTHHRAMTGTYHRNVAGNLAGLDIFMGEPDAARDAMRAMGVTLVATCPGNAENQMLAEWAPGGFLAALNAGRLPSWVEPVGDAAGPLRIFRVY